MRLSTFIGSLAWSLLATVNGLASASSGALRFGADLEEAAWHIERASGRCALVQPIPRFGEVRFQQQSGKPFGFSIDVPQPPHRPQLASMQSVPPAWMHDATPQELGSVPLQRGNRPLTLDRGPAMRLFYELEKGRFAEFHYRDWADGRDPVTVTVSALRFKEVLPEFLDCLAGLIQLDFDVAAEYRIHFATDSFQLNQHSRRQLSRILRAFRQRKDKDVEKIVIAGHADRRGGSSYNDKLSYRRAREIKRYLVRRGIPADRIELRAFGESWPVNPANTPEALAENRRATLWFAEKP
ncbi:OmpA family protein [Thiohalobacter sp. IOR34]|uniref:flagellar protein MotY n=1 Tax=Thiohalobacter sp. IOR34 TaxID=3057176 RepID=UPI0025B1BC29|nr:OmpA family protein [Thiohalobacter sp. IOR34]WJW76773.1 OmpA family protein [Thiohalobacter sp. IOR34]